MKYFINFLIIFLIFFRSSDVLTFFDEENLYLSKDSISSHSQSVDISSNKENFQINTVKKLIPLSLDNDEKNFEITINFQKLEKDQQLFVQIEINDIIMRSILSEDESLYCSMLRNKNIMRTFNIYDKSTVSKDTAKIIFDDAVMGWQDNDPYSTFSIFQKSTKKFMGFVGIGDDDDLPIGISSFEFCLLPHFQGQGYGTQIAAAIIYGYAPELVKQNYLVRDNILTGIEAELLKNNLSSQHVLEKVGFKILHRNDAESNFRTDKEIIQMYYDLNRS